MHEPTSQNPPPLADLDLRDPALLPQLQQELDRHIAQNDQESAYWVARGIRELAKRLPTLKTDRPDLFAQVQRTLNLALWGSLSWWDEREVRQLFETGVREAFEHADLDVWDQVRGFLVSITALDTRTRVKRELREALLRSAQPLAEIGPVLQGKRQAGTIGNWLRYYLATVGADSATSLALASFLTKDVMVVKLTPPERKLLERLVRLFERLKRPSDTIAGVEERIAVDALDDEGRIGVFREGTFEALDHRSLKDLAWAQELHDRVLGRGKTAAFDALADYLEPLETAPLEDAIAPAAGSVAPTPGAEPGAPVPLPEVIARAYRGSPEFAAALSRERVAISALAAEFPQLQQEFFRAVQAGNVARTVAIFQMLAQRRQLARLLQEDSKLRRYLLAVWPTRYGQAAADLLAANPAASQSVRRLVQYVLQERLRLPEGEAARIGAQLGNLAAHAGDAEYAKLAYYDVKEKMFKWLA